MAQTPGYEYDIFISYAHADNAIISGDTGWVTQFRDLLNNWLVNLRGQKALKIWFDESHLGGNTQFDDAIKRGIESSALFFVIHSPNYQRSPYCNQELDWFLDHNQRYRNGVRVGDESRLFNIQIQNIHFDQWSEKLAGTSGFVMHDAKGDELGFPILSTDAQFNKPMRQIIEATEKTLAALAAHSARPEPEPQKTNQNTPKIFIANVPDTLKSFKKQLINEIGDKATILDDLPPPFPAAEHARQLQTTLDQSSLSIHLLDQHSGMEIFDAGDGSTYPKVQADTARQREQKSLIWVPEALSRDDIEEADQASWLDELENDKRQSSGFHFVRSTRQAFIDQVNQEIDQLLKRIETETAETNPHFLIDTHSKDQQQAFLLANSLSSNGLRVEFNQESLDPVKSLENFEFAVRQVKHLIVIFGQVAPQWVSGRIQSAIKVAVEQIQNSDPLLDTISVFMLPNCAGKQTLPKVPGLFNLNCLDNTQYDRIDDAVIQSLLNALRGQ